MPKQHKPSLHLNDEILNEYLDREISPAELPGLKAHLMTCEQCTVRLESLRNIFASLEALPDLPLERDLAPYIIRALINENEPVWLWPKFRWAFSAQLLATILLLLAVWPYSVKGVENIWQAYRLTGAQEWLATFAMTSISALAEGWSSIWQRIWLFLQGYWFQGSSLWDQLSRPPAGFQMSLFGIVILFVTALALWLAGNGLLLRTRNIQGFPTGSNGGNYE